MMSRNRSEDTAGDNEPRSRPGGGNWRNIATTVLLLVIVAIAGLAAYDARSQFWNMYAAFKTNK